MVDATQDLEQLLANSTVIPEKLSFYNDTVTLYYHDGLHAYYRMVDDKPILVTGVTSAIGMIDKSGPLTQWAANMTIEYLRSTVPYANIKMGGAVAQYVEKDKLEEAFNQARFNYRTISNKAKDIGKLAHTWLEGYIKGLISGNKDYPPFPDDPKATNAIEAALDWMKKHNFRPKNAERKIFSREYEYSGTYDWDAEVTLCDDFLCCPFPGVVSALGDFKSSKALYEEYLLQLSAYISAKKEEFPEEKVDVGILLRIGKEDGEFEPLIFTSEHLIDNHFTGFLGALTIYNWQKQLQQDKKGIKAEAKEAKKLAKPPKTKVKIKQKIEVPESI